jgi:hypothetical protein
VIFGREVADADETTLRHARRFGCADHGARRRIDPPTEAELDRRASEQGIGPSALARMRIKERLRR